MNLSKIAGATLAVLATLGTVDDCLATPVAPHIGPLAVVMMALLSVVLFVAGADTKDK